MTITIYISATLVRDDRELPDDSGEVPNSKRGGWQFDSRWETFFLLDKKH